MEEDEVEGSAVYMFLEEEELLGFLDLHQKSNQA